MSCGGCAQICAAAAVTGTVMSHHPPERRAPGAPARPTCATELYVCVFTPNIPSEAEHLQALLVCLASTRVHTASTFVVVQEQTQTAVELRNRCTTPGHTAPWGCAARLAAACQPVKEIQFFYQLSKSKLLLVMGVLPCSRVTCFWIISDEMILV